MSLLSDINTCDVGKTLEKVENQIQHPTCLYQRTETW